MGILWIMKKVALINDLSGFGKCSLTAAIPVISVMGLQACPLPTAILSAQTGFPSFFCDDYTGKMDCFTEEWQKMDIRFDGIHSGYLADSAQISKVFHFLDCFQREDAVYLADPVLGDNGRPFKAFSAALLDGMKQLTARATVATPNLTELCLLTGHSYEQLTAHAAEGDYPRRIAEIGGRLLLKCRPNLTIIITGIIRNNGAHEFMGNLSVTAEESFYLETPYIGKGFSGTGDLFSSVICGGLVSGLSVRRTVELAVDFLQPAIEDAARARVPANHGIHFEKYLRKLLL